MTDGAEDGPLTFVTMDEIVEELRKRTSHFVLVTVRDTTDQSDITNSWYGGGYHAAVGLCELTKAQLVKDYTDEFNERE